ncbi:MULTISPECIES: hypothetical protein [unclassified Actinoplanes]|uniref:hypothetical protein n=1 Tax=unclassified Actinoplanes TaxID=2626549 RepID=UPI0009B07799|nr:MULTISPECIES: hypothetical protein [unclassified Actinoplanes]
MTSQQVKAVLGAESLESYRGYEGKESWQRYSDGGVTAIYDQGGLVAVAIDALAGPMVRLRELDLVGGKPSAVAAGIQQLAGRDDAVVTVNWSGDPEVAAWGLSLGATPQWGLSPSGALERTGMMVTDALFVGAELAEDPYSSEPIIRWRDVRGWECDPGAWLVIPEESRARWDWTPLKAVGPLEFGMTPLQVSAALGGEAPAARRGYYPSPLLEKAGQWFPSEERFDVTGVTAHYQGWDIPSLAAVTVHGRTGPQVAYDGIDLIGKSIPALEATLYQHAGNEGVTLAFGCNGDVGPLDLSMLVRAARAGDVVISEARFGVEDWEDHG